MKTFLVTIAAAALSVGVAQAEGFMPWSDAFTKADANGDGGLSMEEVKDHKLGEDFQGFQPWMTDHFAELDANGDGIVMMDELKAGKEKMGMTDDALSQAFFKGLGFMPKNSQ